MAQPIISVQNLSRHFKQYKKQSGLMGSVKSLFSREYKLIKAVDDLSFSIEPGEMVGFIGPNGAGKTTTLKMLSGLLHPSAGDIQVLGHIPYKRQAEFQKQFAIVMGQKAQLWWDLAPMETFILNKEIYGISNTDFKNIIDELADLLEVKDILGVQVRKLSLGQRMKCELLAALIHNPRVMFLDEPTIGLDVVIQKKIRQFFKDYNQKYNTTVLLTSHYMDDVKELCKRLIIIDQGKLLYDGSTDELIHKYAQEKFLKFIFTEKVNKQELEKFGKVEKFEDISATISVPRENHTHIAAEMLKTLPIDDIDISEADLEDIITHIFSQKVKI
jgi:ABC-2 type transport system ATP-binding protein